MPPAWVNVRQYGCMKRIWVSAVALLLVASAAGCSAPLRYPVVHLTVTAISAVSDGSVDETVGAPCGGAAVALLKVNGVEMTGGPTILDGGKYQLGSSSWKCTVTKVNRNAPDSNGGNNGIQITVAYKCNVTIAGDPLEKTIEFTSGNWSKTYPVTAIKSDWHLTIAAD